MSKKMIAIFSDNAYNDFISGAAVDNNGLRSPKGAFYPDQPSFEPINDRKEQLANAGVQLLIAAGEAVAFGVVLPEVKRFAHEKVYPFVAEKWDIWQEKRKEKKAEKDATTIKVKATSKKATGNSAEAIEDGRIINLDDYRKMA